MCGQRAAARPASRSPGVWPSSLAPGSSSAYAASMPVLDSSRRPTSTRSASTTVGLPASWAARATAVTTRPRRASQSKTDWPVSARSATRTRSARRATRVTSSVPFTRVAPSRNSANPTPPPAPAPGRTASPPSVLVAHSRSAVSSASRVARSAPLPSAKPCAAPEWPISGASVAVAATSSTPATRSRAASSPSRAATRPCPPSVVAVPPTPTTTRETPRVDRGRDELPTPGRRRRRVALRRLEQVQADRLRGLDVRGAALDQHPGRHRVAERPVHGDHRDLAAQVLLQHVEEPGPSVRERQLVDDVVARAAPPALGDGLGGLPRRQAPGEPVRGQQDPHTRDHDASAATGPRRQPSGRGAASRQEAGDRCVAGLPV